MRRLWAVAVVLAVVAVVVWLQCPEHEKPRWLATHGARVSIKGFEGDIPSGWRDAHELVSPLLELAQAALPTGARTLIATGPMDGEIVLIPEDFFAVRDCEKAGDDLRHAPLVNSVTDVERATFAGDSGCLMQIGMAGARGSVAIRAHMPYAVMLQCLSKRDPTAVSATCVDLAVALRPVSRGPPEPPH